MPVNYIAALDAHPQLAYGFSQRGDGNMSHTRGDATDVRQSREKFVGRMGMGFDQILTFPHTRSNNVLVVTTDDDIIKDRHNYYQSGGALRQNCGRTCYYDADFQSGFDAFVSNKPDLCVMAVVADCVGVTLYDPVTQTYGLAHAGLIGCVNDVVPCAIEAMQSGFGSKPDDIHAVLPPSLRGCHYEVAQSVVWQHPKVQEKHGGRTFPKLQANHYDMHAVLAEQLADCGLVPGKIHDTHICTACHHDDYFSNFMAGRQQTQHTEGRFAVAVGLQRH